MSEKCSISSCEQLSYEFCSGCKLNFCQEHMYEHCSLKHLKFKPLINEINQIDTQLKKFDLKKVLRSSYQQLEEWRKNSHEIIDQYYRKQVNDLDLYMNEKIKQYEKESIDIRTKIKIYEREKQITHGQINLLSYQIQNLQKTFNEFKQNDVKIQIDPLIIEENLISFDQSFHLSDLSPVYRVIDRIHECCTSLATNNQLLLLHYEGTLLLVDREFTVYKQIPWKYGPIYDMCYSSTLKRFIILNEEVFLLNEDNGTINKVRSLPLSQQWFSCTCSDTSLYLSTTISNTSIVEFHLLPTIVFVKKWTSNMICRNDEAIDGIVYHDNAFALTISNDMKKTVRFELRFTETLEKIWSLPLDIIYNKKQAFRFSLINYSEWIIADHCNSELIHITKDGKLKSIVPYKPSPCCVIQFGNGLLAISTKSVVNLHKL